MSHRRLSFERWIESLIRPRGQTRGAELALIIRKVVVIRTIITQVDLFDGLSIEKSSYEVRGRKKGDYLRSGPNRVVRF